MTNPIRDPWNRTYIIGRDESKGRKDFRMIHRHEASAVSARIHTWMKLEGIKPTTMEMSAANTFNYWTASLIDALSYSIEYNIACPALMIPDLCEHEGSRIMASYDDRSLVGTVEIINATTFLPSHAIRTKTELVFIHQTDEGTVRIESNAA